MLLQKLTVLIATCSVLVSTRLCEAGEETAQAKDIVLENEYVTYVISPDGKNLGFVDKHTGKDYCVQKGQRAFVRLKKGDAWYEPTACTFADGKITVQFQKAGITVVLKATYKKHYLVFELESISDEKIDELVLSDLHLSAGGNDGEAFAACVLALNLQVNVRGLPGPSRSLWAACYPRFGLSGAKIALVACPLKDMREVIKEVVRGEGLPCSTVGGAWALDCKDARGSYLFARLSETDVDDWIVLAKRAGITQLLLVGWGRYGDYRPHPNLYPNGVKGLKGVIEKIHAAGLKAGMHMHSFSISKNCPWVTPVPDKRLATDAVFTLAAPVAEDATTIPTLKSPEGLPTICGFWVLGGNSIRIDDELITYSGISEEPPYGFTQCRRGAYGTKPAAHEKGATVHHLTEVFGMYLPDGDSTLMDEMARGIADIFNTCEFDMIYFDGLDGAWRFLKSKYAWHYAMRFAFGVYEKINRPVLVEASTFPHHLWHLRSRAGAWDHPVRSPKKFIDIHCRSLGHYRSHFMPGHLGWWALRPYGGPGRPASRPEDIEYLCAKCLAHDVGFSLQRVSPGSVEQTPGWTEMVSIMGRYEALRHAGHFPQSIKDKLKMPGDEFKLVQTADGTWQFLPVQYIEHKVTDAEGPSSVWKIDNKHGAQPLRLRIEALMSAAPYDSAEAKTIADFADASVFSVRQAAAGVTQKFETSTDQVKVGNVSACYTAASTKSTRRGAWSKMGRQFSPPLDIAAQKAMGLWIHGDGKGELLNLQLKSTPETGIAHGEHYVVVDFTGWRYVELIEPEGARHADYSWPYYSHTVYVPVPIYSESVNYSKLASLNLFYNNIPPGQTVTCYLSPVKALPTVKVKLQDPAVTVGSKTIVFPIELESGCYLEFKSPSDCKLYDPNGKVIREVNPRSETPTLSAGENQIKFTCDSLEDYNPRVMVTVITHGEPLRSVAPKEKTVD